LTEPHLRLGATKLNSSFSRSGTRRHHRLSGALPTTTALWSRAAAEIASAAHTARSHTAPTHPAPVAGLLVHCTPQPAPGCTAEPNSLPPIISARGCARIRGSTTAAYHAHGALLRCRCTLHPSTPSSQPASPPPCTAHPAPHNPGDTSPVTSLPDCGAPHEHIPPSTLVLHQWPPPAQLLSWRPLPHITPSPFSSTEMPCCIPQRRSVVCPPLACVCHS
jgi:hypothetical protein